MALSDDYGKDVASAQALMHMKHEGFQVKYRQYRCFKCTILNLNTKGPE